MNIPFPIFYSVQNTFDQKVIMSKIIFKGKGVLFQFDKMQGLFEMENNRKGYFVTVFEDRHRKKAGRADVATGLQIQRKEV